MKVFKVSKIFRVIEKGEFIEAGTVFAVGDDGIYIYTFWKNVPELTQAAVAIWPKKDKDGKIELFRDYWKYYVDLEDSPNYGKRYTEVFKLVTETLSVS
jgi:hypothetical protein